MPDRTEFAEQLRECGQSASELQKFINDFAMVRIGFISHALSVLEQGDELPEIEALEEITESQSETQQEPVNEEPTIQANWQDLSQLGESGILVDWIENLPSPENMYLHIEVSMSGDWGLIERYMKMTFLSDKQRRILFPILNRTRRPRVIDGVAVTRDRIANEVQRLNQMLHWASQSGMDEEVFRKYQSHLRIHGASQNVSGKVGSVGAYIAILDALDEVAEGRVVDVLGQRVPDGVRTPTEIFDYFSENKNAGIVRAILLDNGRAVVFASDPDVAIFQSLGDRYTSAQEAFVAWEAVRRDVMGRRRLVHQYAVGEIKTATDPQNLHERLALGSRETRDEVRTDRFLLMAVLTADILSSSGRRGGRQGVGLDNRDVTRFSDVFNLHFAWGYDGGRESHPEHWERFKRSLADWCGISQ